MSNKIPPAPHETERRLTIRKHHSDGPKILTSSPFKIKLEEKRQAKIDKAEQHRKRKETCGKNFLNKAQKTKNHNASKRQLKSTAQLDSKVNRPKETECIICDKSSDKDCTQCNFVVSGLMKTVQAQKKPLFFVNVTFAKLKLTFNCFVI
jgi:hypothetical protein